MVVHNESYYRYERALIEAIDNADPVTLRGALAGLIRWSDDEIFNRTLHGLLVRNCESWSELRKALVAISLD